MMAAKEARVDGVSTAKSLDKKTGSKDSRFQGEEAA